MTLATAYLFNFFYPSVAVRIFAITRTLARYAERLVTHDATFRMLATLRVWFYGRLEPLAPACLMKYRSGDILNRIVADIDALDNFFVRVLSPTIVAGLTLVTVVAFLGLFDFRIAITALGFLLAAGVAVPLAAGRAGAGMGQRLIHHTTRLRIRIVEGVQGLSELMVYGAWDRQLEKRPVVAPPRLHLHAVGTCRRTGALHEHHHQEHRPSPDRPAPMCRPFHEG